MSITDQINEKIAKICENKELCKNVFYNDDVFFIFDNNAIYEMSAYTMEGNPIHVYKKFGKWCYRFEGQRYELWDNIQYCHDPRGEYSDWKNEDWLEALDHIEDYILR